MTLRGIFSASFYSGRRNKNEVYKEEEKHLLNRLGNKEGGWGGGWGGHKEAITESDKKGLR